MFDWTFDQESSDYNYMQDMVKDMSGKWNIDEKTLLDYMTRIAFHETGPNQRGNPKAIQELEGGEEGKGRGLFQYEVGGEGGGHTAVNRLIDYYEPTGIESMPDWLQGLLYTSPYTGKPAEIKKGDYYFHSDEGFDASSLTPEQQYMLFMADKRGDETASFEGVDTPEELKQFYLDEHYAGPEKEARGKSWEDSMGVYKDTLLDQIMPTKEEAKEEVDSTKTDNSESKTPFFDWLSKPFKP